MIHLGSRQTGKTESWSSQTLETIAEFKNVNRKMAIGRWPFLNSYFYEMAIGRWPFLLPSPYPLDMNPPMKILKSLLFILCCFAISLPAMALEISFIGPCDKKPLIKENLTGNYAHVGALTIDFLNKKKIPYLGNERGLKSVFNTPVGDALMEVVSDNEMRAYGWCYFVNDLGPDVFADEYPLDAGIKKIEWLFGFAHYKNGQWISSCTPAFTVRPKFLCN